MCEKKKVIANPGAFISVIKCSCTDTFQSVFPQCVDWCVASSSSPASSIPSRSPPFFCLLVSVSVSGAASRKRTRRLY